MTENIKDIIKYYLNNLTIYTFYSKVIKSIIDYY